MPRVDIDFSFKMHPLTKDIVLKTGSAAIRQSVINLVKTNYYERGFNVEVAGNITSSMFENLTVLSAQQFRDNIRRVLENFEPNVELIDVTVVDDGENGVDVTIYYHEYNNPQVMEASISLERIR